MEPRNGDRGEAVEQDGCFAIVDRGDCLMVEETLHAELYGEVPKLWRLRFDTLMDARRFVSRLRPGHDDMFHHPAQMGSKAG